MLFLVILVIAIGWAGWFWAWGRDRYVSGSGVGLSVGALLPRNSSALAAPRNATMARKRRREVLAALAVLAILTFLLARSWSALWAIHLVVDIGLVVYAWAVYSIENGPARALSLTSSPLMTNPRMAFQPILDDSLNAQPGPRR